MTSPPDSPVARVLGLVLHGLYPDRTQLGGGERINPQDNTEVLVVSYRRDFTALWDINEDFLAWLTNGTRTVILVWDETPSGGLGNIALSEYVTAADWAVALSLLADRYASSHARLPRWRLVIVDLASKRHPSAKGVRLLFALQRPDAPLVPSIRLFSVEELDAFFDFLDAGTQNPRPADMDILRSTWAAILVNPASASDRHAIINLVAPRVLLSGMITSFPQDTSLPLIRALDVLMKAVGLAPEVSERLPGPWVEFEKWNSVVEKFVLIDDMADLGWEDFLSSALGAWVQLETHTDPRHWRSVCDQDKAILFLDLRLFSNRPNDEIDFFKELLQSAAEFRIDDDEPADSGFYWSDLQAVERVIKSGAIDSLDYYTALTFLPRLISLTDPTLPIVIFSSTGRREIAESLRSFGNIVLGFDKPRFFGDGSGSVLAETRQKFETVMREALILADGRNLCRDLRRQPKHSAYGGPSKRVVEIFLDESQSNDYLRFAVGGLILVHPTDGSPDQLDAALRDEGLVWANLAAGAVDVPSLPKRPSDYGPYLERLRNFFEGFGIEIIAFGLVRSRRSVACQPRSLLLRDGSLDLQNLDLVADAVETTLFDVIDAVAPDPLSICVHLATRVYPVDMGLDADQAVEDWGLGLASWNRRMHYSVTVEDGRQITRMAMRRRTSRSFTLPVDRARAVSLELQRIPKPPRPREIHHLADWIAGFARADYDDVPDVAKSWFVRGFLNEADEAFSWWLAAARAGDEGRWVEALHCAYRARMIERHHQDDSRSFSKFVRRKAANWPINVGAGEFRDLCLRLRTQPGYKVLRVYEIGGKEEDPIKQGLIELFKQFGEVSNVRVKQPRFGDSYALVTMYDEASAGRAVRTASTTGIALSGRWLRVFPATM
jgi:hypothetical protein